MHVANDTEKEERLRFTRWKWNINLTCLSQRKSGAINYQNAKKWLIRESWQAHECLEEEALVVKKKEGKNNKAAAVIANEREMKRF